MPGAAVGAWVHDGGQDPVDCGGAVWKAFDSVIAHHEEYPDADWAMSSKDLQLFKDAAAELAPTDDPRRYSKLFDWQAPVPGLSCRLPR